MQKKSPGLKPEGLDIPAHVIILRQKYSYAKVHPIGCNTPNAERLRMAR